MITKLLAVMKKHHNLIMYLIFGVLTTMVNYIVFLPCYNVMHLGASVSNAIAWAVAVFFAFVTNKPFVFRSYDWSARVVMPELVKFVGTRLGSGALETLILLVTVDLMQMNGNLWKLITSVIVVVVNYIGSKLLVFKK